MQLVNIKKITEGLYSVESLPCPKCGDKLVLQLPGRQVHAYHNNCYVDEVLPDSSPEDRERFITGICPPCWEKMFNPKIEIIGLEYL